MLTEVKKQFKVTRLSVKFALMREMLNKVSFITNVLFMILNNSAMVVQWIVLFSLKPEFGGYTLKQVLLLWALASGCYGVSRFFFKKAFSLSDTINSGKLDAFIVQPKSVLLSAITSDVEVSAIGDMLFSIIFFCIYGFSFIKLLLFVFFCITGGLLLTAITVTLNSLSFWFGNADMIAHVGDSLMINFATYPDGIFKGIVKWSLFTIIPLGLTAYLPVKTIINFNPLYFVIIVVATIVLISIAVLVFNLGLKRYSSSNLMSARV